MSRVANSPIAIPPGVDVKLTGQSISINGKNGKFDYTIHKSVSIKQDDNVLNIAASGAGKLDIAMAGTMRALVNNMLIGVNEGFEKKLTVVGVGYRAKAVGKKLDLSLGFSHPVSYDIPAGIEIETPSNTEIIVKGCDKQLVGQVSAEIRAYRPPEPYKGKGVHYHGEHIIRKEAKKK